MGGKVGALLWPATMLQLFRSFQWLAILPLLAVAVGVRAVGLVLQPASAPAGTVLPAGAWGEGIAASTAAQPWLAWTLGVVAVTLVGYVACVTLQTYRLDDAGSAPALLSILLGSALVSWLGFDPRLLAALALAGAAHQLFDAYRRQGDALPIYNTGLLVGLAWLLHVSFVWFALWAFVALVQLRKVRAADLLGMLIGIGTLPLLWLMYAYVFGDWPAAWFRLWRGALQLPTLAGLQTVWVPLAVLVAASLGAFAASGSLTNRRPVQEQRAHRMWYTMLSTGWVALLLSGGFAAWPIAYVIAPLSVLLGVWLVELPPKLSNGLLWATVLGIAAGYVGTWL